MNNFIRHDENGGFTVFPFSLDEADKACRNGKWKLPDFREIAYTGERLYAHGMRAEMDACELLSGPRLQLVFKVPGFLLRFS